MATKGKASGKSMHLRLPSLPAQVLPALAQWTTTKSHLFNGPETPFQANYIKNDRRLLLITGENASGKSLAFRLICQLARTKKIEVMALSVRERTGSGTFERRLSR